MMSYVEITVDYWDWDEAYGNVCKLYMKAILANLLIK